MGWTVINFRGNEFTADDAQMEVWLHFLVKQIDLLSNPEPWLREAREDWYKETIKGPSSGVAPDLDYFITTQGRRDQLLELCTEALRKIESFGEYLSQDVLNAMKIGGEGSYFVDSLPTERFLRSGRFFIKLLDGSLKPDESDSRI